MTTLRSRKKIYCVLFLSALCIATFFFHAGHKDAVETLGTVGAAYESLLFDTSLVHTIDIEMEDWQGFLSACTDEHYVECDLTIDGESYRKTAIRAKGNTSLSQVESSDSERYSFKIEFDHYNDACRYHGLDKLCLNNIIQDNTYIKDYLTYQMMGQFGIAAPLCSFAYITVNGEDWGLYLAVEGVEDAFLARNYGQDPGSLYKPDSSRMGGGKGFGGDFRMSEWTPEPPADFDPAGMFHGNDGNADADGENADSANAKDEPDGLDSQTTGRFGGERFGDERFEGEQFGGERFEGERHGGPGAMGSGDVSLLYSDDDYASYENIFDNAKTELTDDDKDRLIAALKGLNAGDNLEETVDIDSVIRYFVVHNFVCNFDSYTGSMIHNYYLYEKNGRLSMIPWDYNLAFGGFEGSMDAAALVNYPIDTPVSGGSTDSRPMLAWIFADEEYTTLYHRYFEEFVSSCFDSGLFSETVDSVQTLIAPYVERDPTKFCTYGEFETGIATLKDFCLLRAESVSGQLAGSIPSTTDGQAKGSATLVDASALDLSAMGTMGHGKGGRDERVLPENH